MTASPFSKMARSCSRHLLAHLRAGGAPPLGEGGASLNLAVPKPAVKHVLEEKGGVPPLRACLECAHLWPHLPPGEG